VELFIVIRDHLFQLSELRPPFDIDENVEDFNKDDSRRSWRTFLSVSKTRTWQLVRKHTMIWSLNCVNSEKYITDEIYKSYLQERMNLPHKQLQLQFSNVFRRNSSIPNILSISELSTLKLLHEDIIHLADLKTVQSLTLGTCDKLDLIGNLQALNCLSIHNVKRELLSMFPLERLEKAALMNSISLVEFGADLHRFHSLRYLYMTCDLHVHHEDLPSLECLNLLEFLVVKGYKSFDLSGLMNLKSLEYSWPAVPETITGKEQIFPRLRRLTCLHDPYFNSNFNFPNLKSLNFNILRSLTNWNAINNIQNLFLRDINMSVENFTVGENVKNLTLLLSRLNSIEFLNPKGIYQLVICCKTFTEQQLALFSHLQSLEITCLHNIRNISAVKDVPILSIASCHYIENFSCLGSQSYLTIYNCYSLTDKDVENYGAVLYLSINFCEQLTEGREYIHSNLYRKIKFDPRSPSPESSESSE
jgi:hypothetical protein